MLSQESKERQLMKLKSRELARLRSDILKRASRANDHITFRGQVVAYRICDGTVVAFGETDEQVHKLLSEPEIPPSDTLIRRFVDDNLHSGFC